MGVKVHLYSGLKEFTGGQNIAEVRGSTAGECLADKSGTPTTAKLKELGLQ
jgi:hypothetical protein